MGLYDKLKSHAESTLTGGSGGFSVTDWQAIVDLVDTVQRLMYDSGHPNSILRAGCEANVRMVLRHIMED